MQKTLAEFAARFALGHGKVHGSSLCTQTVKFRIDNVSPKWTSWMEHPSQNVCKNCVEQLLLTCIDRNPAQLGGCHVAVTAN